MKGSRTSALFAAFGAAAIYGINHTLAKGVMPGYIEPYGFILLRVSGAAVLFWLISIFTPKQRIDPTDRLRIMACAVFGMVINMLMFFKGLSLSTPINSSVIVTLSPIIVFVLSAIFIGEKVTWKRSLGIILGLGGALGLIWFGEKTRVNAPNIPLGNLLFMINAISYAIYLVLVKPLTAKYHPITLMKWLFLTAIFINLPFTWEEFSRVSWDTLPLHVVWKMVYVVVGTTFLTYLLNVYALQYLKASTIGAFIYLQPLIGILFAVFTEADSLSLLTIIAALFVFTGVYLVSQRK